MCVCVYIYIYIVYETTKSQVSLDCVLNTNRFSITGAEAISYNTYYVILHYMLLHYIIQYYIIYYNAEAHEKWLVEAREGEHKSETEEFGISSFPYRRRKPFHPGRLAVLLREPEGMPRQVLRAKGFVWVATRPNFAGALIGCRISKAKPTQADLVL